MMIIEGPQVSIHPRDGSYKLLKPPFSGVGQLSSLVTLNSSLWIVVPIMPLVYTNTAFRSTHGIARFPLSYDSMLILSRRQETRPYLEVVVLDPEAAVVFALQSPIQAGSACLPHFVKIITKSDQTCLIEARCRNLQSKKRKKSSNMMK